MKTLSIPFITFWITIVCTFQAQAQEKLIHSHNDYEQRVPFYQAYSQQLSSIEADVFATANEGELLVAHESEKLSGAPSIDEAYINPLVFLFKQNNGRAWRGSDKILTLLVDLKTPVSPTLDRLIEKLKIYPHVFDPTVNPYAVRVVISGKRPLPDTFIDYPSVIMFDGAHIDYTTEQLKRISMISLNLRNYTQWDGNGKMPEDELEKVKAMISSVHKLNKPIRFWGTPDGDNAWHTFHTLGVDYINTDQPEACAAFFRDFNNNIAHANEQTN